MGGEGVSEKKVEWFFSFRSPYSYLSGPRAFALPDRFDVDIEFRGVAPMAMRGQSVPSQKRVHTVLDTKREATRLGMPFGPVWDPIGDGAIRCLRISEHARDAGRVREFVLGASRAIWAEGVDVSTDAGLRPVCERAGLVWADCQRAISDPDFAKRVDSNVEDLLALGHWGVPVFRFGDEVFWGQDRIEDLERLLTRAGLARQSS